MRDPHKTATWQSLSAAHYCVIVPLCPLTPHSLSSLILPSSGLPPWPLHMLSLLLPNNFFSSCPQFRWFVPWPFFFLTPEIQGQLLLFSSPFQCLIPSLHMQEYLFLVESPYVQYLCSQKLLWAQIEQMMYPCSQKEIGIFGGGLVIFWSQEIIFVFCVSI